MTQCQARTHRNLGVSALGYPEIVDRRCTRAVGVTRWADLTGTPRAACPAHLHAVRAVARRAELAERVRHDAERDANPPMTVADWIGIRPEMARSLR